MSLEQITDLNLYQFIYNAEEKSEEEPEMAMESSEHGASKDGASKDGASKDSRKIMGLAQSTHLNFYWFIREKAEKSWVWDEVHIWYQQKNHGLGAKYRFDKKKKF